MKRRHRKHLRLTRDERDAKLRRTWGEILEALIQTNEILADMPWIQAPKGARITYVRQPIFSTP